MKALMSRVRSIKRSRGVILVVAALVLVAFMGFVALAVDIGVITVAQGQLKTVADAAALAGARQLLSDYRLQVDYTPTVEVANASGKAISIGQANNTLNSTAVVLTGDVEVGYKQTQLNGQPYYDPTDATWKTVTDPTTNSVRVTAKRDGSHVGVVPALFSRVLGSTGTSASVASTATVETYSISGFTTGPGMARVLPIAMSWDAYQLMIQSAVPNPNPTKDQNFHDQYSWNPSTGVTNIPDKVPEASIYPVTEVPSNWGTVTIPANNNNGTSTLGYQILNGIPAADVQYEFTHRDGSGYNFPANPGMSSGLKDYLSQVIGKVFAVPIFSNFNGQNGSGGMYAVVGFASVRLMAYDLTGPQAERYLYVQPAFDYDTTAIPGSPLTLQQGGLVRLHLSR